MSPAREAAFRILLRVDRESAYAVERLHSSQLDHLSALDRNLTHEIVMGVLRWRSLLDSRFTGLVSKPLQKLDLEVLTALRMGAYQMAFLDRMPAHAIVNETVELVKKSGKRSAAGLVNAVMRKLQQNRDPKATYHHGDAEARRLHGESLGREQTQRQDQTQDTEESRRAREQAQKATDGKGLARDYAHPQWLVERWTAEFGQEKTEKICRLDQQVPTTVVRLSNESDEAALLAEGIQLAPGALMSAARVVISGDITGSKLFRSRQVAIQDEGSQLVAALVGKGKRILDCCAAPGGKTAALATALPEAEIFAAELHPHRARLLRELAPQKNVLVVTADARQLPFAAEFDRVLTDMPCSGTGTLARNPEIKWRLKPEDITDLQSRQLAILKSALRHVSPGGHLVYATCSLEREENEQVVETILKQGSQFRIIPMREVLLELKKAGVLVWQDIDSLVQGNYLRTLPGVHPCDGFFAAVLTTKDQQDLVLGKLVLGNCKNPLRPSRPLR